jgi:hypothetical protein
VTLVEENFVFPLPDAEVQYGWTEENEIEEKGLEEDSKEDSPSDMHKDI